MEENLYYTTNQPTNPPSPSLWNAFAAAETDALKADFTTFLRVHFVCRCHARARRRQSERGIRVGNGMPN